MDVIIWFQLSPGGPSKSSQGVEAVMPLPAVDAELEGLRFDADLSLSDDRHFRGDALELARDVSPTWLPRVTSCMCTGSTTSMCSTGPSTEGVTRRSSTLPPEFGTVRYSITFSIPPMGLERDGFARRWVRRFGPLE